MSTTPGLETETVSRWLAGHAPGAEPPFSYSLVPAGGSNLTYRVGDAAGHQWVLRRPPVAAVLRTAHDMDREWRIIDTLGAATAVPVPPAVASCADPDVTGAPFYVMGFVNGQILRDDHDAQPFAPADAEAATDSLVDTQLAFHAVDPDAVGLGGLSRHRHGYVERQLHRWRAQVEDAKVRDLPLLDELHDRLTRTAPPDSGPPGLAHGDYRFDNVVLSADHAVAAVLDWELCTIGDPVADFAWSLLYWSDPGDPCPFLPAAPTLASGFPRRAEVARRYEQRSGRSLDVLPWFAVFGYWKMACIVEGVYTRRLAGSRSGSGTQDFGSIASRVDAFLEHAADLTPGVC